MNINKSSKSGILHVEKMERYLRKEETQVYVIGTREPTMFLQDNHRYQILLFELPYEVNKN